MDKKIDRNETLWISVNDRLPEIPEGNHAVSVLCSVHDPMYEEINPGHGSSTYTGVSWDGEKFKTLGLGGNGHWGWFEIVDIVTHWMYVPKPFQITDPEFTFNPKGYAGYLSKNKKKVNNGT
jgi:hypothetical protein